MNEIRNQTRAAVVSLWHFIKFNQIQSEIALKIN
jgi:hypothetical protein